METSSRSDPLQDPSPRSAPRASADEMLKDAKEAARSTVAEQQHAAASGLGDLAEVLRNAARQLEGDKRASVGRLAESAADGLERVSATLRTKDLNSMLRDTESFARAQPVAFFGAAVAVGFLAVRFLKSSQKEPAHRGDGGGAPIPPYTRV
jgi:hypothetical protein